MIINDIPKNLLTIKIITIMKNNSIETRGGQTYETPSVEVIEVIAEQVFATSFGEDDEVPGPGEDNEGGIF